MKEGNPTVPDHRPSLFARMKAFGELRDVALLATGALYLLGYLSWAAYAGQRRFGMLPVLDAQYIAAGIVPALVVALAYGLFRTLLALSRWSAKPPSPLRSRVGKVLSGLGTASTAVYFVLGLLVAGPKPLVGAFLGAAFAFFYAAAIVAGAESKPDRLMKRIAVGYVWVITFALPVSFLLSYQRTIFPALPQELGGPRPQCVQMDLETSRLSPATLAYLVPARQASESAAVRHSQELFLLFEGRRYTIVALSPNVTDSSTWWKVDNTTILALTPCPAVSPVPS